jgi:uncharacterized membrane protein YfcA
VEYLLIIFAIGLLGGALAGLLGIGGGIVTAPLLLYLPPLLGQPPLSMHIVGGLTITQSLGSGLFGAVGRWRQRTINWRLAGVMSAAIFVTSAVGAAGSKLFSHTFLLAVFAMLALLAAVLLFLPRAEASSQESTDAKFSIPRAVAVAAAVGLFGGLVGQTGSFLLIPLMVVAFRVDLRVAMGSNLVVIFVAALAGFLGKAFTGQLPAGLAVALLAGILPGTLIGTRLNGLAPTRSLRLALGALIFVGFARVTYELVG